MFNWWSLVLLALLITLDSCKQASENLTPLYHVFPFDMLTIFLFCVMIVSIFVNAILIVHRPAIPCQLSEVHRFSDVIAAISTILKSMYGKSHHLHF